MCLVSNQRLALVWCLALNAINLNSGATNSWTAISSSSDSSERDAGAEIPQYSRYDTSFQDGDSFQVSDDISVVSAADGEQPLLPSKGTATINNIGGVYHNYRSSYKSATRTPNHGNDGTSLTDIDNKLDEMDTDDGLIAQNDPPKEVNDFENEIRYNVGPGVNISVDKNKELVSVFLDEDCLKDVFTGRGRKNELITKILPLFILPFLIQSAVVPFLLSTLKLLLIKSILVGKIAIFLLLLSAFRNHVKYAYDVGPSYYSEPPSRRSELRSEAQALLNGYRVEGKPTTWVN